MANIDESTKQRIRDEIARDPDRWARSGGNENGPRELEMNGHEILIAWDPLENRHEVWAWTAEGPESVEI